MCIRDRVPQAELLATAKKWAGLIAECSPMSIRASKEAVMKGFDEPSLKDAIVNQRAYPALTAMFKSEDLIEGPLAFSQKRAPKWKGR